jgi:LPS O-antigen subunit length determinant protein (WzzB/FepE family)
VLYALLATPVYRAVVVFLPPAAGDIQALNIEGVHGIDIKSVYTMFKKNLSSRPPRQAIYEKMNLLDRFEPDIDQDTNLDVIFDEFNQSLSITTPKVKKGDTVIPIPTITFAMEWEDPVLTAEIVNRIAEEAEQATKVEILSDIETRVNFRVMELNGEVQRLRDITKKRRRDEIERLETADALERNIINDKIATLRGKVRDERLDKISKLKEGNEIAHSLNIKDPFAYRLKKISDSNMSNSQILTGISSNAPEIYTRGYEAIEAEITSLSNRKVDDPFIPELRGLQEKLKLLEHNRKAEQLKSRQNDDPFIASLRDKEIELARLASINIDPATVKTAHLDQAAFPPDKRIKPNRKLIVVLGFMLGLMLGVLVAFFANFLENQRKLPASD